MGLSGFLPSQKYQPAEDYMADEYSMVQTNGGYDA